MVKFRLSGEQPDGISLGEATNSLRFSRGHNYSLRDLAPDARGRITLKVRVRFFLSASGLLYFYVCT